MPKTAYSKSRKQELDVKQLISSYIGSNDIESSAEILKSVPSFIRDLVSEDILCPSCGVSGASLVSGAVSKRNKEILREAHFRFNGENGEDAHRKFCEFAPINDELPKLGGNISLEKARTAEQKEVRLLVCKAIEKGLVNQSNIRSMRQWYFDTKTSNCYQLNISEKSLKYIFDFLENSRYGHDSFTNHPYYGEIPNYNWRHAARSKFFQNSNNAKLLDVLHKARVLSKASEVAKLASKFYGSYVFDVTALEPYYQKTIKLCSFATMYLIRNSRARRYSASSNELLAFCSLLLSVSDWNIDSAIQKLIKTVNAPEPQSLLLGNIIGLNPFHDYDAWRIIKIASEIQNNFDLSGSVSDQISEIVSEMETEHKEWRKDNGLPEIPKRSSLKRVPMPSSTLENEGDIPF